MEFSRLGRQSQCPPYLNGASDPGGGPVVVGDGVATAPSNGSCYDNGNSPGATEQYSMEYQNGANLNCALSFKMQGGD